jgi:trigger factor
LSSITDNEVKFSITVTVKPEIELGQYTGLLVKKVNKEVTDADIDAKVKQAQEKAGSWENITGRAIENGDTIELNYSGTVDGIKFDGGTAENQTLVIGSGTFIPGFEEQLIGSNIGEEKDIKVTFPKEYGMEQLNGKEANFAVKINNIKKKVLPEIDDEFVKDVSEFDTVAAYKDDIRKQLKKANDEQADNEMTNSVIDKVILNSKMEIPAAMIEAQIDDMVQEFSQRISYQGMKLEDYFKYSGMKMEDLRLQYKDTAVKNIKIRLVLDAIIKKENIQATDTEVDAKIKSMADEIKKDYEEYKKNLNPEYMDYFKNLAVSDKLIKFLKNNNTFTE